MFNLLAGLTLASSPWSTHPTTYSNRKARLGLTSIANHPHEHNRATARRLRQAERNTARQAERLNQSTSRTFRTIDRQNRDRELVGVSRRGLPIYG